MSEFFSLGIPPTISSADSELESSFHTDEHSTCDGVSGLLVVSAVSLKRCWYAFSILT